MEIIIVVCFTVIIIIQQRIEIKREGGEEEPKCRGKL